MHAGTTGFAHHPKSIAPTKSFPSVCNGRLNSRRENPLVATARYLTPGAIVILLSCGAHRVIAAAPAGSVSASPKRWESHTRFAEHRLNWLRAVTIGEFHKLNPHSTPANKTALRALRLFCRWEAVPSFDYRPVLRGRGSSQIGVQTVYEAWRAWKAGCRDPLIRMIIDRSPFPGRRLPIGENVQADIHNFIVSAYAPALKLDLVTAALSSYRSQSNSVMTQKYAHECLTLLAAAMREKNAPVSLIFGQGYFVIGSLAHPPSSPAAWKPAIALFHQIVRPAANTTNAKYIYHTLDGTELTNWGWHARGVRYAANVTNNGWKKFESRLRAARVALRRAYALRPDQPEAPAELMVMDLGLGHPNRIRKWFRIVRKVDPDNFDAYWIMLDADRRRWYGSTETMFQFARQCLKQGHWHSRIPFIGLKALEYVWHPSYTAMNYFAPNLAFILYGNSFWRRPDVRSLASRILLGYIRHCPRSEWNSRTFILWNIWMDNWPELYKRLEFLKPLTTRHGARDIAVCRLYYSHITSTSYYMPAGQWGAVMRHWMLFDTPVVFRDIRREARYRSHDGKNFVPFHIALENRFDARKKWAIRMTAAAMEKVGGPAVASQTALESMIYESMVLMGKAFHYDGQRDAMLKFARKAARNKIDNPVLDYFAVVNRMYIHGKTPKIVKAAKAAARSIIDSKAPFDDRFMAATTLLALRATPAQSPTAGRVRDTAVFDHLLAENRTPVTLRYHLARAYILAMPRPRRTNFVNTALRRLEHPGNPQLSNQLRHIMVGWLLVQRARIAARGFNTQRIHAMHPAEASRYLQMLSLAKQNFHAAWKMNPDSAPALNGLITAQFLRRVRTRGDEHFWPKDSKWLIRAVHSEDFHAMAICVHFLAMTVGAFDGKDMWYRHEDIVELMYYLPFGRAIDSPRVRTELAMAARLLAYPLANAAAVQVKKRTLLQMIHFWHRIQPAAQAYLLQHPRDYRTASRLSLVAGLTGHWKVAFAELGAIGNHVRVNIFGGRRKFLAFFKMSRQER